MAVQMTLTFKVDRLRKFALPLFLRLISFFYENAIILTQNNTTFKTIACSYGDTKSGHS